MKYMSLTSNTKQSSRCDNKISRCLNIICLFVFLVGISKTIETTIIHDLNNQDKQTLQIAHQLSNIVVSQINLQKVQFTCATIMPVNLTKSSKQRLNRLNITNSFKSAIIQRLNQLEVKDSQISGFYEDYIYDKILDLLHGSCALHETTEFVYQYCHKQIIRQFDTDSTKVRMAKPKYEDITLGYFNYQQAIQYSETQQDIQLKHKNKLHQFKYDSSGKLFIIQNIKQIQSLVQSSVDNINNINNKIEKDGPNIENNNKIGQQNLYKQHKKKIFQKYRKSNGLKLPSSSQVYNSKNLFTVESVNFYQIQFVRQSGIIRLNYPLINNNFQFLSKDIQYEVTCEFYSKGMKNLYITKARVLSSFDLAFLGNSSKCDSVVEIQRIKGHKPTKQLVFKDKLRTVQNYLYGNIDQLCTGSTDWDVQNNYKFIPEVMGSIQVGTTLLIGVTHHKSKKQTFKYYPVTVIEIIGPGVVKLEENLEYSLNEQQNSNNQQSLNQQYNANKQYNLNKQQNLEDLYSKKWITNCRIISNKLINISSETSQNKILTSKIIKIQESADKDKKSGDQIICLCKLEQYTPIYLEMHIALGYELIESTQHNQYQSVFQYFEKEGRKRFTSKGASLYQICGQLICYDIQPSKEYNYQFKLNVQSLKQDEQFKQDIQQIKQEQIKQEQKSKKINLKLFTSIQKLTATNSFVNYQKLDINDQILLIDLEQNSLIKIYTKDTENQQFYYLITKDSILKIKQYINGTKQIIKQNQLYQNYTIQLPQMQLTSLYIHQHFMWRINDKLIFPRMDMKKEQIINITRIAGIIYVRKWNISKMRHKNAFKASQIRQFLNQHYKVKNFPLFKQQTISEQNILNQNEDQFNIVHTQQDAQTILKVDFQKSYHKPLNNSIGIKYQYFHGQFCGAPIQKNRRTDVQISCGPSWLKLDQVKQTSPCIYQLKVSSKLLCSQNYTKVVQNWNNLKKINKKNQIQIKQSTICYPKQSSGNNRFTIEIDNKQAIIYI